MAAMQPVLQWCTISATLPAPRSSICPWPLGVNAARSRPRRSVADAVCVGARPTPSPHSAEQAFRRAAEAGTHHCPYPLRRPGGYGQVSSCGLAAGDSSRRTAPRVPEGRIPNGSASPGGGLQRHRRQPSPKPSCRMARRLIAFPHTPPRRRSPDPPPAPPGFSTG